jgi:hypothetical protein
MIENQTLVLPQGLTLFKTFWGANILQGLRLASTMLMSYDPPVRPIPEWWMQIADYAGKVVGNGSATFFSEEEMLAAANAFNSSYIEKGVQLNIDARIMKRDRQEAESPTSEPTPNLALYNALARASMAATTHIFARPGEYRLSDAVNKARKHSATVDDKWVSSTRAQLVLRYVAFLLGEGTDPLRAEPYVESVGTTDDPNRFAWSRMVFARAYHSLIGSAYLASVPSHPSDKELAKNRNLASFIRSRRIELAWWRARLEIDLIAIHMMAKIVMADAVLAELRDHPQAAFLDAVKRVLAMPISPAGRALLDWCRVDTGPTPYGKTSRTIVDMDLLDVISNSSSVISEDEDDKKKRPRKKGDPAPDIAGPVDLLALAKRFVSNVASWESRVNTQKSSPMADWAQLEQAMGLGGSAAPWGTIGIPYGGLNPIYVSGDGISHSRLTLGDMLWAQFIPARSSTDDGEEVDVGVGIGHKRVIHERQVPNSVLASQPVTPPFVHISKAEPFAAVPAAFKALDLRAFRPLSKFIGQSDVMRIVFGSSPATALAELRRQLGEIPDREFQAMLNELGEYTALTQADDKLPKPLLTYQNGELKASHSRAFYDPTARMPWISEFPLSDVPSVWNSKPYLKATRLTMFQDPADAVNFENAISMDDQAAEPRYEARTTMRGVQESTLDPLIGAK